MPRLLAIAVAAVLTAALATDASAAERHGKTHVTVRPAKGVGFLPGYRTPEQIERDARRYGRPNYQPNVRYWDGSRYYIGGPGYYRGRFNGGSFGPCYKYTPIGPMWTCG